MSVTSNRSVVINWTSDVEYTQEFPAAVSPLGSGVMQLVTVTTALTVTVPTNAVGVMIIPPVSNTTALTIKGIAGDTGIGIHLTDPTSLGLSTTQTTIILAAATTTSNVRLIFS